MKQTVRMLTILLFAVMAGGYARPSGLLSPTSDGPHLGPLHRVGSTEEEKFWESQRNQPAAQDLQAKLKAAGFPECPSDEEAERFCAQAFNSSGEDARFWFSAGSCPSYVATTTHASSACSIKRMREDLKYKTTIIESRSTLEQQIREYNCKTGRRPEECD